MIGGVRLLGRDALKVLVDGRQIGNVYRFSFEGKDGKWKVLGAKYRLAEEVSGDVEIRFLLGPDAELVGVGQFFMDCIADNEVHREPVEIRGSHVWIQNG